MFLPTHCFILLLLWHTAEAHFYLTDPAPRATDDAVYTFDGSCEENSCDSFCGSYAYNTGPVTITQPGAYTIRIYSTQVHPPYQMRVSFNGQNSDGKFDSTSIGTFPYTDGVGSYEFEVTLPDDPDCYDQPCVLQVYDLYYFVSCANVQYEAPEWTCSDLSNPANYVIDVRTEDEWNDGHVGCAHLIPLSTHFTEEAVSQLTGGTKDAKIILYCRSGNRAGQAKGMLEGWGYTNVVNAMGYTDIVAAGCSCDDYTCTNAHSASWADYRYVYVPETTIVTPSVEHYFCECLSTKIEPNAPHTLVSLDGSTFSLDPINPLEDAYNEICAMSMGSSECASCTLPNPFTLVSETAIPTAEPTTTKEPTFSPSTATGSDCLTMSTPEEQILCLQNRITSLEAQCDAISSDAENTCVTTYNDVVSIVQS